MSEISSDRTSQSLILSDGRHLGFAEYGASVGRPVFHSHGSASSRLDRPASESVLTQRDIRFISVDRPGHGLSDPQPSRRLIDWPQDVAQLADYLGISEFHVTGHSAGGPHALACAHQLADRVAAGAVISSGAPMGRPGAYQGMPALNQILARSARHFPWLTSLIRRIMRNMLRGDVEKTTRQLMASIPDTDRAALYAPQNVELLAASLREGFRQGFRAVAQDDVLTNQDWGFDLKSVKPRIDIWHGEADVNVPIHAGQYLRDELPNRRAFFLPGAGHFFLLTRWEEILSELVHAE